MSTKLYVSSLSPSTDEDSLRNAFGSYGDITEVVIPKDNKMSQSRGHAWVTFASAEEAAAAVKGLNEKELDGREIKVRAEAAR